MIHTASEEKNVALTNDDDRWVPAPLRVLFRKFPATIFAVPAVLMGGVGLGIKALASPGFRLPPPWVPALVAIVVAGPLVVLAAKRGRGHWTGALAIFIAAGAGACALLGVMEPRLAADVPVLGTLTIVGGLAGGGAVFGVLALARR